MPKINLPTDITPEMKEAKKDYLDRHTPHVVAPAKVKKGETFQVLVRMGQDYVHPDLEEHYIQYLQLYKGDKLLATAIYNPKASTAGKDPASGHQQAAFFVSLDAPAKFSAMSYCTLHGLWVSEEVHVEVE
ncbi:MAG: desulfoferrodoxin family protein [Candidatus Polarisedimenticolia bacterium]|nr:dethiobiotin synthase [bacterium]